MAVIFNGPVLSYGLCKLVSVEILAENGVTHIFRDFIALLTHADHHADRRYTRPVFEDGFSFGNGGNIVITILLAVARLFVRVEPFAASFRPVAVVPVVVEK